MWRKKYIETYRNESVKLVVRKVWCPSYTVHTISKSGFIHFKIFILHI